MSKIFEYPEAKQVAVCGKPTASVVGRVDKISKKSF